MLSPICDQANVISVPLSPSQVAKSSDFVCDSDLVVNKEFFSCLRLTKFGVSFFNKLWFPVGLLEPPKKAEDFATCDGDSGTEITLA
jgi:hypothetical protein